MELNLSFCLIHVGSVFEMGSLQKITYYKIIFCFEKKPKSATNHVMYALYHDEISCTISVSAVCNK